LKSASKFLEESGFEVFDNQHRPASYQLWVLLVNDCGKKTCDMGYLKKLSKLLLKNEVI
jgi:hypothetical protein